jgi:hypothetical protein
MKAKYIAGIGILVLAAGISGCAASDVVGKLAKTSFDAVVAASGPRTAWSEADEAWTLSSPVGDEISFSGDFSKNNSGGMSDMEKPDAEFSFDAAPFLAAGLDLSKLPAAAGLKYEIEDGRFMIHFELGDSAKTFGGLFSEIVRTQRGRIGYHEKLDHYGIKLGNGNMFEWAKDLSKNDKDIVWVLNPEPFQAAGLDPAKISGWTYAKVETKDDSGKTVFVDKLLKPFDIK